MLIHMATAIPRLFPNSVSSTQTVVRMDCKQYPRARMFRIHNVEVKIVADVIMGKKLDIRIVLSTVTLSARGVRTLIG